MYKSRKKKPPKKCAVIGTRTYQSTESTERWGQIYLFYNF